MDLDQLIKKYSLHPHPEGGFFAETYRSAKKVIARIDGRERSAVTDIYYLLQKGQISRFHKVVNDEIWHFYEGEPLKLIKYDGTEIHEQIIGPNCGGGYKMVVEGGIYQAAMPIGEYSLIGCTVAPGFEFQDFSFLADDTGLVESFKLQYPDYLYLL